MSKQHLLVNSECVEGLATIPDACVSLVLCDPPFGVTRGLDAPSGSEFTEWNNRPVNWDEWWSHIRRVSRPKTPVVIMGVQPFTTDVINSNAKEFKYEWIWVKSRMTGAFNARKRPMTAHTNLMVFVVNGNGGVYHNVGRPEDATKAARTVIEFPSVEKPLHFSQKPVNLCTYLIETYSNPGEIVLDPFMGSGTTGVAANATGRRFIGFEAQEKIYRIARKRIAEEAE